MNKQRSIPQVEFDIVKEALVALGVLMVAVVLAALVFGAPYSKAITIQQVAQQEPHALIETAMRDLTGQSAIAEYGPPYNNNGTAQHLGFFSPERWFGVTHPVNPPQVDVLGPLQDAAVLNPALAQAVTEWKDATASQQAAWVKAFDQAEPTAPISATSTLQLPAAAAQASGPLPLMMSGELQMARAGLLAAAIDGTGTKNIYQYSEQDSLLFLQGQIMEKIAAQRNLLGNPQWGIVHEEANYPGPWWLTPYAFLYQIPPYSTSPNGDMMAAGTMAVAFLILLFLPLLPLLNRLPKWLRVYRLIWRDYYRWVRGESAPAPVAAEEGDGHHAVSMAD